MGLLNTCSLVFSAVFWDDAPFPGSVGEHKSAWAAWLNFDVRRNVLGRGEAGHIRPDRGDDFLGQVETEAVHCSQVNAGAAAQVAATLDRYPGGGSCGWRRACWVPGGLIVGVGVGPIRANGAGGAFDSASLASIWRVYTSYRSGDCLSTQRCHSRRNHRGRTPGCSSGRA